MGGGLGLQFRVVFLSILKASLEEMSESPML